MALQPNTVRRIRAAGYLVFGTPYSANLLVERGPGVPGDWDGRLTFGFFDGIGAWHERSVPCATRPGLRYLRSPMNPAGTAMLAPGQHRLSHARGVHNGRPALVQVVKALPVLRDPDRDDVHEPTIGSTGTGLNIHDVESPNDLAGCIGLTPDNMAQILTEFKLLQEIEPALNARVTLTLLG